MMHGGIVRWLSRLDCRIQPAFKVNYIDYSIKEIIKSEMGICRMKEQKKYYIPMGTAAVEYDGCVFFSGIQVSGLYRMDIKTGEVDFICTFEKEDNEYQLHSKAYIHGDEIWFMPYSAKYIACVNVNTFSVQYYNLPTFVENEYGSKIYGVRHYDSGRIDEHKVYLVPTGNNIPIVLDMQEKKVISCGEIPLANDEIIGYGSLYNNKVWMIPIRGSNMYYLDIEGKQLQKVKKLFKKDEFSGSCVWNDKLWIAPYKSDKLRTYDFKNNMFEDYSLGKLYNNQYTYRGIIVKGSDLWILPWSAPNIISFNPINKEFHEIPCDFTDKIEMHYLVEIESDKNSILFSEGGYGKIDCLMTDGTLSQIKCWMTPQKFISHLRKIFGEKYLWKYTEMVGGMLKDDNLGLNNYIESLIQN